MKRLLLLFFCLASVLSFSQANHPELFPIPVDGKYGFIDHTGKVIVDPIYHHARPFSEGLAAVRKDGLYGYIDHTGKEVIPARYDRADAFTHSVASVYEGTKQYLIDRKGNKLFEHDFAWIVGEFNEHGLTSVGSHGERIGMVNREGKLVVDTMIWSAEWVTDDLCIVLLDDGSESEKREGWYGLMNGKGEIIVDKGRYRKIQHYWNGMMEAQGNDEASTDVIDHLGRVMLQVPEEEWTFPYYGAYYNEGLATANFFKEDKDEYKYSDSYIVGVVDIYGRQVFADERWELITPYSHGRAFAKDKQDLWFLLDTNGNVLNKTPYTEVVYNYYQDFSEHMFSGEIDAVEINREWWIIDLDGNKLEQHPDKARFLRYAERNEWGFRYESQNEYYQWDLKGNTVFQPSEKSDGKTPVLSFRQMEKGVGYFDQSGKCVWKTKDAKKAKKLNIAHMLRGSFYASSPRRKDTEGAGGWGSSNNEFEKVKSSLGLNDGKLGIFVDTTELIETKHKVLGYKVYLYNTTNRECKFDAQDSRLYMNLQAKDKDGEWKNIEYLPSSWCGNSYHQVYLPKNHLWTFETVTCEGAFETELRIALFNAKIGGKDIEIKSNSWKASINPGQFWNKLTYRPGGLMDPYND